MMLFSFSSFFLQVLHEQTMMSGLLKHEKQPKLMALGGNVTPPLSLSNCCFRGVTEESD